MDRATRPVTLLVGALPGIYDDVKRALEDSRLDSEVIVTRDPAEFDRIVAERTVQLVILGPQPFDPLDAADVISLVDEHAPFSATILITDADRLEVVPRAKAAGLDEVVVVGDDAVWRGWLREAVDDALEDSRLTVVDAAMNDLSPEGVVVIDRSRNVRSFNHRADRLLERLADIHIERGGQLDREVVGGMLPNFEEALDLASESIATAWDESIRGEDGSRRHIEVTYTPLERNGDVAGCEISFRDVTDQKRVETELKRHDRVFWAFFESLPIGAAVLDLNGRLIRTNDTLREMLGYSRDQLLGEPIEEIVHPNDVASTRRAQKALSNGEREFIRLERRFIRGDGEEMWGDVVKVVMPTPEDQDEPFVFDFITDTTEQRRLQREAEHAERMRALGQLAGGVAHDFNNVLSVVNSYAQLIERSDSLEGVQEKVERIRSAVDRGSELAHQLLTFGRQQTTNPEFLALGEIVEELQSMLERLIPEDIALEADLQGGERHLYMDRSNLEQIIMNLVLNARDAMPAGGKLGVATRPVEIPEESGEDAAEALVETSEPMEPGHYVELSVSDTGVGMDEETRERIFEAFFTTKDADNGTGLGLSNVYGIVQQNAGHIEVDTAPDEGSTFRVYLPTFEVGDSQAEDSELVSMDGPALRGEEKILVVEDDEAFRSPLRAFLNDLGYQITTAESITEALKLIDEEIGGGQLDLLLSDVVLPDGDGVTLARKVQERKPECRVILMSGYPKDNLVDRIDAESVPWPMLEKPFTMESASATVREALEE